MVETPQQWHARVQAALAARGIRETGWEQWPSWPFEGGLTVRPLDPPADAEPPRGGAGGVGCFVCEGVARLDPGYLVWQDDLFVLGLPSEPSSLPFAMFLMPKRHADLQDLSGAEAARQGELLALVERAACTELEVPRIQVARWGDGGEHLHWWLFARPTGMLQLRGTFLSHWDDLLPRRDPAEARRDAELVAARLVELAGGSTVVASS